MLKELYFWSTLLSVGFVVAVALAAGAILAAVSHNRGTDRITIRRRLEWVWLAASIGVVAIPDPATGTGRVRITAPGAPRSALRIRRGDALANLVLYVPVGFLAALLWRTSRRPVVWATALAFGVSFSIEFAQLILPIGRSAQFYDVVFNTVGGLVGGLIGALVSGRFRPSGARVEYEVRASN